MKYFLLSLSFLLSGCAADVGSSQSPDVQFKPLGAETSGEDTSDQSHADSHAEAHSEFTPYDPEADAAADIAETLAATKADNKKAILVFGANWCHDSRALAAHFDTPRFQTLIQNNYKLTYIDVGQKDRNIDLAQKFGVESIVGTPTVFITDKDGAVLNAETAPTWRDAASREDAAVWDYFQSYVIKN